MRKQLSQLKVFFIISPFPLTSQCPGGAGFPSSGGEDLLKGTVWSSHSRKWSQPGQRKQLLVCRPWLHSWWQQTPHPVWTQGRNRPPLTWSACLYSRSTCPCAAGGCSGWRPPRCRTFAWPPAWSVQGPCRADTGPSGRSWAAGGWSPVCRCPHPRCWRFAFLAPWASPQTRPEWFHAPACRRLQEEFKC